MADETPQTDFLTPAPRDPSRANRRMLLTLGAIGVGMFAFAFANAPLFDMLCRAVGIQQNPSAETVAVGGEARPVEVRFMGGVHGNLPISFGPVHRLQNTRLGEQTINDYKFVNLTDRTLYFRPVHSVTPTRRASECFKLFQCFCFDDQMIRPNQSLTLPVVYTIGTDLPADIDAVTLNYTLFELTEKDYLESVKSKGAAPAAAPEQAE